VRQLFEQLSCWTKALTEYLTGKTENFVANNLLYLYCIFPGFQAENGVLMCNQKLIIDDREVQGLES
jgi:hypothetical protein